MTENEESIVCIDHLEGKKSRIVIEDKECIVVPDKKKPPTFILGFTGAGLIGIIVVNELIEQLKMKQIGYVLSEDLPPITVFYNGILKHPFRLYHSPEHNLIVSICEVPFLTGSYTDLARTLMAWALKNGIKEIVCLQGLADMNLYLTEQVIVDVYAAGDKEIMERIEKFGIKRPPKGIIAGAEAAILNECLNNHLHGVVYLSPANPQMPSPEGSAAILGKLKEIYGLPVSNEGLIQEANEIKKKLFELAQKSNEIHQQQEQRQLSYGPAFYT